MKKQAFDSNGVNNLLADLYALSDVALAEEVALLSQHFSAWLKVHFEFTPKQLNYLQEMDGGFLAATADTVAEHLSGRGPVALIRTADGDDDEDRGKIVDLSYHDQYLYSFKDGPYYQRSLLISISYQ